MRDLRTGELLATRGAKVDKEIARHIVVSGLLRGQICARISADPRSGATTPSRRPRLRAASWPSRIA